MIPFVIELYNLKWKCEACSKIWEDQNSMRNDTSVEADLDYDEFVYFHNC